MTDYLHEDVIIFVMISRQILLRMRNVLDKCRGNQNKHFVFNNFLVPKIVQFMRYCGKMW